MKELQSLGLKVELLQTEGKNDEEDDDDEEATGEEYLKTPTPIEKEIEKEIVEMSDIPITADVFDEEDEKEDEDGETEESEEGAKEKEKEEEEEESEKST